MEARLLEESGGVARLNGPLGVRAFSSLTPVNFRTNVISQEQRLWVADPKAVHHILQGFSDLYGKPPAAKELGMNITDTGLGMIEGKFFLIPHAT